MRLFRRPGIYSDSAEEHEKLRQRGMNSMLAAFDVIDEQLAGKVYLIGDFTIADTALYYKQYWAPGWKLPPNVQAHYERMKARTSVQASHELESVA